ncbi:MAG: CoA-binding protein, partial [Nitrospinota bacterium]|nr:CoA-binding protein [Nitrospinota bacterium]
NCACTEIEGVPVYKSVMDIPGELDRITIYLPPERTLTILEDMAKKGAKEIFLNPGSENSAVIKKSEELGLNLYLACSIIDIGFDPNNL